ncbi:MAG: hypothetical protein ACE1ZS_06105, partial [Candidatus Poribacteria bacterium]
MTWQTPPSLMRFCREILPLLHRHIDGKRLLETVASIVETDRWNSFDRFHDTTQTLVRHYEEAGATVEVTPLQTGGRIGSGRWIIHEAADVHAARVDIVHPVQERVLDYQNNPWHVIQWSAATPREGMKNEMVILDSQEELERIPPGGLAGKIVLTRMDPRPHLQRLADTEAVGVITDRPVKGLPEATAWTKFGWGGVPLAHAALHLVGLVLSADEGERLRKMAQKHGKLTLHTKVDIRKYVGTHDVVSGIIRGAIDSQDELWVLAHSSEPGALDNASGVALCIEVARVLEGLIAEGLLRRPRRSIRLLHAYECYGFFKYLEDVKRLQTPLAGVVVDTVGSKLEVCDGRLEWHATIPMSAGFVDRVGEKIIQEALALDNPGYQLFVEPFMSTSDTLIGDPKYGFPAPWLTTHYRDKNVASDAYHSSGDTLELVSADGLAACTAAMAGYLYFLANADSKDVVELATAETDWTLNQLKLSAVEANYLREGHRETIKRLKRWLWGGDQAEIMNHLDECERQVREVAGNGKLALKDGVPGASRIPHRKAVLSPDWGNNTHADVKAKMEDAKLKPWALFWADGNRRIDEIAEL